MAAYPSEQADRFQVRMPDGLRSRIVVVAKANKRSANSEIIARLEASFEAGANGLASEIASMLDKHIETEVQRRLRAIASQAGAA